MRKCSSVILMISLVIIFSACSKKSNYSNVIPVDASEVAAIHLKNLVTKAGLSNKENKETIEKLTTAFKSGMSSTSFKEFETILKNPEESGIDLSLPIYLFNSPELPYMSITAKVNDKNKLASLFEILEKEKICAPLNKVEGYHFTEIGTQLFVAFNSNAILIINHDNTASQEEIKQKVTKLFEQTEKNSIVSTSAFKKMQQQNEDVDLLVSPSSILGEYAQQINYGLPENIDLKKLWIVGGLSFEEGKIKVKYENYTEDATLKKQLEDQQKSIKPIQNSLLKYFPKSTLALFNVGINGDIFYNLIQKNKEFQSNFPIAQSSIIKSLLGALKNDLTVGVTNITMESTPTIVVYADVDDENVISELYKNKKSFGFKSDEDIIKLDEQNYIYKSSEINFYFGIKDRKVYITNDNILKENIGKECIPSAKNADFASEIKGKSLAFVVNTDAILHLPVIKMMKEYGGAEYETYYNLANKTAYLELLCDNTQTEITLQLKDKKENSLKQIIDFIKEFAGI